MDLASEWLVGERISFYAEISQLLGPVDNRIGKDHIRLRYRSSYLVTVPETISAVLCEGLVITDLFAQCFQLSFNKKIIR